MNNLKEIYAALKATNGTPVLDFDGVVADTEPLHERAYIELLSEKYGVEPESFDFSRYVGRAEEEIYRLIEVDHKVEMDDAVDKRDRLDRFFKLVAETKLKPTSLVRYFIGKRVSPLYILSSQDPVVIDRLLRIWQLRKQFSVIQFRKCYPSKLDAIEHLHKLIDTPAVKIFHFEDSADALEISRQKGHRTILIRARYNIGYSDADWTI